MLALDLLPSTRRLAWLPAIALACGADPAAGDTGLDTEPSTDAESGPATTQGSATTTATATATATTTADATGDVDTTASTGVDTDDPPQPDANPLFDDLQPGEVMDLGPFTCTPPDGEEDYLCLGVFGYGGMTFDPNGHRVLSFGGGHATTMNDSIHALDLAGTPAWTSLYEPTPCSAMTPDNVDAALGAWISGASGPFPRPVSAHTYDLVAFAPELDEMILLGRSFTGGYCSGAGNDISGPIAHFVPELAAWEFSGDPSTASVGLAGAEYDPTTGHFVTFGPSGLSIYDPVGRTMIASIGADDIPGIGDIDVGYANHMTYFPPDDTFYYVLRGTGGQVVALHLDRETPAASSVELVATSGTGSPHVEPGYDYDPVNHIIGGGVADSTFYAFDPATGAWTSTAMQGGAPGTQTFHALVYDAIDGIFVFVSEGDSGGHTWAYRHG